jgi:hypothetical protein
MAQIIEMGGKEGDGDEDMKVIKIWKKGMRVGGMNNYHFPLNFNGLYCIYK